MEVVVARFAEPLEWLPGVRAALAHRSPLVTVYNKGPALGGLPAGADRVIDLPNVGRNDHTILHHMTRQTLADVTLFLPGSAHHPYKRAVTESVVARLAAGELCTIVAGPPALPDVRAAFADFAIDRWAATDDGNRALNPESELLPACPRPFGAWFDAQGFPAEGGSARVMAWKGVFAASRADVEGFEARAPGLLARLRDQLATHSNPEAGHYMERAWSEILLRR